MLKLLFIPILFFTFLTSAFSQKVIDIAALPNVKRALSVSDSVLKKRMPCFCCVIETEAQFINGEAAWKQFLNEKINACIADENGAPAGRYEVTIRFLVEKDGSLQGLEPITCLGFGMEKEIIRAVKQSPYWIPATRNGRLVRAYKQLKYTFAVEKSGRSL